MKYFNLSATHSEPFPMAIEALGNHHLAPGPDFNQSKARELFIKAAEMDSPEGHFSLALMLRYGHVRNISFLLFCCCSQKYTAT